MKPLLVILGTGLMVGAFAGGDLAAPSKKKLIEVGWDDPTPEFLQKNIRQMEKDTHFSGVGIVLNREVEVDGKPFVCNSTTISGPVKWKYEWFKADVEALKNTKTDKFTDNFLRGSLYDRADWFDDKAWDIICNNYAILARIAREGKLKGIFFDNEHYGDAWQFSYKGTKADYKKNWDKARERGRQFMTAIAGEYPDMTFFTFLMFSCAQRYVDNDSPFDTLRSCSYGMMAPFFNGMLDAMPPQFKIVEGNEDLGYRAASKADFDNIYARCRRLLDNFTAPENRNKVKSQVQLANAIYLDAFFVWPKDSPYALFFGHPGKMEYFSRMLTYALETSDEYVWIWNECGKWWAMPMSRPKEDRITEYHKRPVMWKDSVPGINDMIFQAVAPVSAAQSGIAKGELKNLIRNGSFDSGTEAWGFWHHPKNRTVAKVNALKASGTGFGDDTALEMSRADVLSTASQHFKVRPGERYLVRGYSRSIGNASGSINIDFGIDGRQTHRKEMVIAAASPVEGSEWEFHQGIAEVPADYDGLWVHLFASTEKDGRVLFDKVELYKIEDWPGDIRQPRHPLPEKVTPPVFSPNSAIRDFKIENGVIRGIAAAYDPSITSNGLTVDADKQKVIRITLQTDSAHPELCQIFWAPEKEGFSEKRTAGVRLIPDGKEHEYVFNLKMNPEWKGTITRFRIDPVNNTRKENVSFVIKNLSFTEK